MTAAPQTRRREDIAHGLAVVQARIARAEADSGRPAGAVTLIVVTKTYPAADVVIVASLGVADVGENRVAEAHDKRAACADLPVRWHFVGRIQTNKAAAVAAFADVVHGVDRPKVAGALSTAVVAQAREPLTCLVQVSLDGDPHRGGCPIAEVPALADDVAARPGLLLGGVMAVAPLGADPDAAFERLATVAAALRADHPAADWISAGMSGDLEAAIRHGATHVRVGAAVLGTRPPVS